MASDQRALDEFVDVAREEKELMHLWNIFVVRNPIYRCQRVPTTRIDVEAGPSVCDVMCSDCWFELRATVL